MHTKYARSEKETAYDYSENSNTSLLVSAANSLQNWTGLAEHVEDRNETDKNGKTKLKKGRFDAYLATENTGYLLELKHSWVRPQKGSSSNIEYWPQQDKIEKAREQIHSLHHKNSFAVQSNMKSFYGAFLVMSFKKKPGSPRRPDLFYAMEKFCKERFDTYAIIAPALSDREMTVKQADRYRPIAAIALNKFQ